MNRKKLLDKFNYKLKLYRIAIKSIIDREAGVLQKKREVPLVVSLTSIPERINYVYLVVECLLSQTLKPDYLILWLSKENGLDDNTLPFKLKRLKKRGLEIRYSEDLGPYRKLIPTLKEFPDSIIVTADDDMCYPPDWLRELYESYESNPEYIHCHRAHEIIKDGNGKLKKYIEWDQLSPGKTGPSKYLFPTTGGGVLFPPNSLHSEVLNKDVFMDLCPLSDDIWVKAMSLMKGTLIKKVNPYYEKNLIIRETQDMKLWKNNVRQGENDKKIERVFEKYDLYKLL